MTWLVICMCPRCGHCATVGERCINCKLRGRESVQMVPYDPEGVPTPLFYLTPEGGVADEDPHSPRPLAL